MIHVHIVALMVIISYLLPEICYTIHSRPTTFRNQALPFELSLTIFRQNETWCLYIVGFVCIPSFDRHLADSIFKRINLTTCDRYSMTRLRLKNGNTQKQLQSRHIVTAIRLSIQFEHVYLLSVSFSHVEIANLGELST
jgi:hypothetical protein